MADGSAEEEEEEDLTGGREGGRGNLLDSILAYPPALTLTLTSTLPDLSPAQAPEEKNPLQRAELYHPSIHSPLTFSTLSNTSIPPKSPPNEFNFWIKVSGTYVFTAFSISHMLPARRRR